MKLHITLRLEVLRPGKTAAFSLNTVVKQEGIPKRLVPSTSVSEAITRPIGRGNLNDSLSSSNVYEPPMLISLQVQFHKRIENAEFKLSGRHDFSEKPKKMVF